VRDMADRAGAYTLLAMPQSGEAVLARDERQNIWLVRFVLQYDDEPATQGDVDAAVTKYGWERIDRDFGSWAELDDYRLTRARAGLDNLPKPDIADLGPAEVQVILRQVRRAGPGRRQASEDLLIDLLARCRAVRDNERLASEVTTQLDAIRRQPPTPPPHRIQTAYDAAELDEAVRSLTLSEDELLLEFGRTLVGAARGRGEQDPRRRAANWFTNNQSKLRELICGNEAVLRARQDSEGVMLLAELLGEQLNKPAVFSVAAYLLKRGIDRLCDG